MLLSLKLAEAGRSTRAPSAGSQRRPCAPERAASIGTRHLGQLWLFWVAPIVGGVLAGIVHRALFEKAEPEPPIAGDAA